MEPTDPRHVWRPPPTRIPRAWVRRTAREWSTSASRTGLRIVLVIVRNLIPLAGYAWWDWSAGDVVLLGAFNLGSVFSCAGCRACATPMLLTASGARAEVWPAVWAGMAVAATWAVVFCVAQVVPPLAPFAVNLPYAGTRTAAADSLWWSAAGVSLLVAMTFWHELRGHVRELRARHAPVRRRGVFASARVLLVPILMEGWVVCTIALPLMNETDAVMSIAIVTAASLFLDVLRTFAPAEFPTGDAESEKK